MIRKAESISRVVDSKLVAYVEFLCLWRLWQVLVHVNGSIIQTDEG